MKLARWQHEGRTHDGLVEGGLVYPFIGGHTIASLVSLGLPKALEVGALTLAAATGAELSLNQVKLLVPIQPPSIRDFVAFEEHVEGVVKSIDASEGVVPEWYEYPTFYFTNPNSLIATGDVMSPPVSQKLDFELEVGVVVGAVAGRDGTNLTPAEGHEAIFGYTIFNDWSARDIQGREMKVRLGPCKGKDFATTLGPWIVTADEFVQRHDAEGFLNLLMTVSINGTEVGRDSLANMGWSLGELVAYASRNSKVLPGDVLGSGTAGAGCLAELWGRAGELTPAPLKAGDEVVMTVEGIGEIRNVVGEAVVPPAIPRARVRPRMVR